MKKQWLIGVAVAAGLALMGCGKSTCSDLTDADNKYEEKYRPCLASGETQTKFNQNQCEAGVDKCTDAEKTALADYADCVRKLPDCTPNTKDAFGTSAVACITVAQGKIGQTCQTAIFGQ